MIPKHAWAFILGLVAASPVVAADPVVAVVNGRQILRSEIEEARPRLPDQLREMPEKAITPLILSSLIDTHLLAAEARKAGLAEDPEFKHQMAGLEERILERLFLDRQIRAHVTQEALKDRYRRHNAQREGKPEVRARHIVADSESEARAILERLAKGADFAELAGGGDLGWFTEAEVHPDIARAAFALEKGKVSAAPVRSAFGWHVIRVEDRRIAKAKPFAEVEEELRTEMTREVGAALLRELRAKAEIKVMNGER
ncbi:MAG: peptidyl-prolyl cis-trans isomerase [Magnetospirillum sp. WYHS-4]